MINNGKKSKWTLMFFFASDNILSPSMLTQIKAIKAAGYQQDTNVLLHFDPNEKGAPTRIFEVNRAAHQENTPSKIGDCSGPLVSVLTSDDITPPGDKADIDALKADAALANFLTICGQDYPAEHYMLFLVGHGMVVGRDAFLPDENPVSAIGLCELGGILKTFNDQIRPHNGVLELIGMHSCSMSGVEVSYQLHGKATYMLGSQGVSFVGAWPYRQLLITIFNAIEGERKTPPEPVSIPDLVEQMHDLCIQHSADFMVGGYAADLCLSTLSSTNIGNLDQPIKNLSEALTTGLQDPRCQELILLAHWKSQSYWQETYTDLYDFCLCLSELSKRQNGNRPAPAATSRPVRSYDKTQQAIEDACDDIMKILKPKRPTTTDGPIIRSDYIGAATQYSHGLSIYFPWSEPIQDKNEQALIKYSTYEFATRHETKKWLEFLKAYFDDTQRPDRLEEDGTIPGQDSAYLSDTQFQEALKAARDAYSIPGTAAGQPESVPTALDGGKVSPPDSGGGACTCLSIKNYSKEFLMSLHASKVFVAPGPPSTKAAGQP